MKFIGIICCCCCCLGDFQLIPECVRVGVRMYMGKKKGASKVWVRLCNCVCMYVRVLTVFPTFDPFSARENLEQNRRIRRHTMTYFYPSNNRTKGAFNIPPFTYIPISDSSLVCDSLEWSGSNIQFQGYFSNILDYNREIFQLMTYFVGWMDIIVNSIQTMVDFSDSQKSYYKHIHTLEYIWIKKHFFFFHSNTGEVVN